MDSIIERNVAMTATKSQGRERNSSIEGLLDVMRRLRDPTNGCPWDVKQNFATIAPYTIEEAYEVADAISRDDMADLVDELGDLLFQVVFHAQMASEAGHFTFDDVVAAIVDKMIRRHPHVFGDEVVEDEHAQSLRWEAHKAAERGDAEHDSLMDNVPRGLSSIKRAQKLQKRAATAGFDWHRAEDVIPKIREELDEITEALTSASTPARLSEEMGDLLFSCINLARHLKVDAEMSLRATNTKFERRFRWMEDALFAEGKTIAETGSDVLEAAWSKAKTKTG